MVELDAWAIEAAIETRAVESLAAHDVPAVAVVVEGLEQVSMRKSKHMTGLVLSEVSKKRGNEPARVEVHRRHVTGASAGKRDSRPCRSTVQSRVVDQDQAE